MNKKEKITQMRERHIKEIIEIENSCKHEILSGWEIYEWAPGHQGGEVKVCTHCGKYVETRTFNTYGSITTTNDSKKYQVVMAKKPLTPEKFDKIVNRVAREHPEFWKALANS